MNPLVLKSILLRRTYHFCDLSAKDAEPLWNHKETSDKPTLRDILQNNQPITFKSVKVKIKGRLREFESLRVLDILEWILLL